MGFFDRLRDGLARTKQQIVTRFEEIVQQADTPEQRTRPVDVDTIEALEELLVSADVGVAATERIVTAVRARARRGCSRAWFTARRWPTSGVRRSMAAG